MSPCEHEIKNGRNWGLVQFLNYLQFCTHLCLNACYFNNPFSLYRNLKCQPFSCMMKIWCGKLCFHNLLSHCIIRKQKYLIIVLFIFFVCTADICRVCRSEGSLDKPLYHPCVCTGSIKFIHQEWYEVAISCLTL